MPSETAKASLGYVTSYGAARRGGYQGTYEEWCALMAEVADHLEENIQLNEDSQAAKAAAETAELEAEAAALTAESWAKGTKGGTDVPSTDPAYHDNAKYYAGEAEDQKDLAEQAASAAAGSAETAEGHSTDAEAWAAGTRGGEDVESGDDTYHNNAKYYSEQSSGFADDAAGSASDAESWAKGTKNGTDVPSTDPTYHNNAKYWSEQAEETAEDIEASSAQIAQNASDIGDLKTQLDDLNEFCRKEIISEFTGNYSATAGTAIPVTAHLIDVNIANGEEYKFVLNANGTTSKYNLYANGEAIKYNCVPGTIYTLKAVSDITWVSIYCAGTDVTESGTITAIVQITKETENSLEERIDDLSALADNVSRLDENINIVSNEIFTGTESTPSSTSDRYKLSGQNGLCVLDEEYQLRKFVVTAGNIIKVTSDHKFQFQTVAHVPSTGVNSDLVGVTYGDGEYIVEVPQTAVYLIVSTKVDGAAKVYTEKSVISGLEKSVEYLDDATRNVQEEIGTAITKQTVTNHGTSISSNASKTIIHAETGWEVSVLLEDTQNKGITYYLYPKYEEDETTSYIRPLPKEGTEYHFISQKTLEYIYVYVNNIQSGTATITVKVKNSHGLFEQIESALNYGHKQIPVLLNATYNGSGAILPNRSNRITTGMIKVNIGDVIFVDSGSLGYACGGWKGEPSLANNIRNDSKFKQGTEKIVSPVDGYYCFAFAKSDTTQSVTPFDFDGSVLLYTAGQLGSVTKGEIPDYWFANDYLSNKVDRINANGIQSDDVFVFITDVHWEYNAKHSPEIIKYLSEQCRIPRVFHGGDLADAVNKMAYDSFTKAIGKPMYMVMGNHDWFPPETGESLYYWYDSLSEGQRGNAFGHYWYIDNAQSKIRYIILESYVHTGNSTDSGWTFGYDSEQVTWFRDEALNVPDGYDVIVFDHNFRNGYTGQWDIVNAIINFNTETANHGKVLFALQGHRHWDGLFRSNGNLPIITTTCDRWDVEPSIKDKEDREFGTINEHAFEIVSVNKKAGTVSCIRIGAKAQDNVDVDIADTEHFSFNQILEERIVHYGIETVATTKTLTPTVTPGTWYSSNTAVCTVSNGTVTAVGTGSAWVYSINDAGQLEGWIITVA